MDRHYNNFTGVGTLGYARKLETPEVKMTDVKNSSDKNKTTNFGHYKTVERISSNGMPVSTRTQVNLSLEVEDGAREYLEVSKYSKAGNQKVYYFMKEGDESTTKLTLEQANDPTVVSECISAFVKSIELGDVKISTLAQDSFVDFIIENHDQLNGKKVYITGGVTTGTYKGGQLRFEPQRILEAKEDAKSELIVKMKMVVNNMAVQKSPFKTIKDATLKSVPFKPFIQVQQNIDGNYNNVLYKTDELFGLNIAINYEMDNAEMVYNLIADSMGKDILGNPLEAGAFYESELNVKLYNAGGNSTITENDLTDQERVAIEYMGKTLDDIIKMRGVRTKSEKAYLVTPIYVNGLKKLELSNEDFYNEDYVYKKPQTVNANQLGQNNKIPTQGVSSIKQPPMGMPSTSTQPPQTPPQVPTGGIPMPTTFAK